MGNQSINSMSFVISAAYTFTFANSIYLITTNDPGSDFVPSAMSFTLERTMCGLICLVMTLRFFFGNNQYIADAMEDRRRSPWQKFFQFFFIALQSVVLLICSYCIPNTIAFISAMAFLFALESFWYVLTYFIDSVGIKTADGRIDRPFLFAQLSNAAYWIVSLAILKFVSNPQFAIFLVFLAFIINTVWDAAKNMRYYMEGK
jgi:hypothetical protein